MFSPATESLHKYVTYCISRINNNKEPGHGWLEPSLRHDLRAAQLNDNDSPCGN